MPGLFIFSSDQECFPVVPVHFKVRFDIPGLCSRLASSLRDGALACICG